MDPIVRPVQYGLPESPYVQKLTPLDMNMPRLYGARWIMCFPLDTDVNLLELYETLRTGLAHTIHSIPWIAGNIGPEEGEESTSSRIQVVDSSTGISFIYRDLTGVLPSYNDMKAKGFPLSQLSTEQLGPIGIFADTPQPVMKAQANFVKGGLLLSVGIHHSVGDATALDTIVGTWAHNTAASTGSGSFSSFDSLSNNREPLMRGMAGAQLCDFPEYHLVPSAEIQAPQMPPQLPPLTSHIFHFAPESLSELKSSANAFSTNDALCAFLWSRMTVARWPDAGSSADEEYSQRISAMGYAINIRNRTSPPLPPTYLGNGSMGSITDRLPVSTLLAENGLMEAATAIRRSLAAFSRPSRVPLTIGLLDSRPDPMDFKLSFHAFLGPDVVTTSWADIKLYEKNWGALGFIESLRIPGDGSDGTIIVLPRMKNGGLETVVGLESGAMDRLLKDEQLNRIAKRCG